MVKSHLTASEPEGAMAQSEEVQHRDGAQRMAKKPYVKPEFRHEKVFETMALSCGKVQHTQHGCHLSRKNS
jgi:hypothetical protein